MYFVQTQAATAVGMPLPDAIGFFSGEFATLQSSSTLDSAKQVFVVGIREKVATLKLLRAGLAERVTGDRSEGDTAFLRMSEGGTASAARTASRKYYYLAVTPGVIVASAQDESMREILASPN